MSDNPEFKLKPGTFVISFAGKVKHDTRWFAAKERCLVQSGLCMLEMEWPEAGDLKVIEYNTYKQSEDKVKNLIKLLDDMDMHTIHTPKCNNAKQNPGDCICGLKELRAQIEVLKNND